MDVTEDTSTIPENREGKVENKFGFLFRIMNRGDGILESYLTELYNLLIHNTFYRR